MLGLRKKTVLSSIHLSDEELFLKTADRLQTLFRKKFGLEYNYGRINFVFLNGQFLAVQEETGKTLFTSQVYKPTPA